MAEGLRDPSLLIIECLRRAGADRPERGVPLAAVARFAGTNSQAVIAFALRLHCRWFCVCVANAAGMLSPDEATCYLAMSVEQVQQFRRHKDAVSKQASEHAHRLGDIAEAMEESDKRWRERASLLIA